MKKVRLALGAAGIAPALGVAAPAAAAHAPEGPAANTAPAQVKTVRVDPATGCVGKVATKAHLSIFSIWVYHTQASGCVGGVSGFLDSSVPALSMRTRIYTINAQGAKTRVYSQYRGGDIKEGQGTFFRQDVHTILGGVKQQVCAALVDAKPHRSHVEIGPVCVSFPS